MMTDPHLRLLTKRCRPMPPGLTDALALWADAAKRAGPVLSEVLSVSVETLTPTLSISDERAIRQDRPGGPGVLCPVLVDGMAGSSARVSAAHALRLAALLLREETGPGEDASPKVIDALLARPVIAALLESLGPAVGRALTCAGAPSTAWPPGPPGEGDRLAVDLPFRIGDEAIEVALVLAEPARFLPPAPVPKVLPRAREAALACPVRVDAVIASWRAPSSALSSLAPGALLPLPGATFDALELRVRSDRADVGLAAAEMGRDHGHRAVRVTRPTF